MLIKVAQDQAERLRPRQWQVPPDWPGQSPSSPSPADPYAERVAEMRTWGLLPRGFPGGWICPRCRNIVPYLDTDGPLPGVGTPTPQHIVDECVRDHHAARLNPYAGLPGPDPYAGTVPVTCGVCGLAVPMDISEGMIHAIAALYEECATIGHAHRFPGPKMSCLVCGGPLVEDDGRMVCPDHPTPPPTLGGTE
jgi:hypothetical protein